MTQALDVTVQEIKKEVNQSLFITGVKLVRQGGGYFLWTSDTHYSAADREALLKYADDFTWVDSREKRLVMRQLRDHFPLRCDM